jgi:hypothetical protein
MGTTWRAANLFESPLGRHWISGGGSVNVLRQELATRGVRFWFCAEARASHHLAPFFRKRLRVGAYLVRYRQLAPSGPWAWVVRVPLAGPLLASGGTMVKAWRRAWWFRHSLPARGLTCHHLITIAAVKAVEAKACVLVGARVDRRFRWLISPA